MISAFVGILTYLQEHASTCWPLFRAVDAALSRRRELHDAALPDQDALTVHDFSEVLGWLIIKTQEAGVDVRDQITMLQCAADALRANSLMAKWAS